MSDAHTVQTRAWAGPHGVTWKVGVRNVPEQWSPFQPLQIVGEGMRMLGVGELLSCHLFSLSPAQPFTHPVTKSFFLNFILPLWVAFLCLLIPSWVSNPILLYTFVFSPSLGPRLPDRLYCWGLLPLLSLGLPKPGLHPSLLFLGSLPACTHLPGSLPYISGLTSLYLRHISDLGSLLCPSTPSGLSLAYRSPEGKGAQGNSALSPRPGTRPGNGGPSGCPNWGG